MYPACVQAHILSLTLSDSAYARKKSLQNVNFSHFADPFLFLKKFIFRKSKTSPQAVTWLVARGNNRHTLNDATVSFSSSLNSDSSFIWESTA